MRIQQSFILIFLVVFTAIHCDEKVRYDDYRVYKTLLNNEDQFSKLNDEFSVWMASKNEVDGGIQVDVMVEPNRDSELRNMLDGEGINYEVKIENVQKLIDDEIALNGKNKNGTFNWKSYPTLDEIYEWLNTLSQWNFVTVFSIGQSYEGRDIYCVKISYKKGNPGIFIESNIHGREWITSATATYLINELLTSDEDDIREMAENIDWYIIPVLNVDGFVYTHEIDRMWRKTRKPNLDSICVGTDGSRNFDFHWMEDGSSKDPCSPNYAGNEPFSEPETAALAKYYESIKDKISIYLSFHSYGQFLLSPYGYTAKEFPPNYDQMLDVARKTVEAIRKIDFTRYVFGSVPQILTTNSGISIDWAYGTQGTKLAYIFKFRDLGQYGFLLLADQIIPNSEEVIDGLLAMTQRARELGLLLL